MPATTGKGRGRGKGVQPASGGRPRSPTRSRAGGRRRGLAEGPDLRSILDAVSAGVVRQDAEGRITHCNAGAWRLLGLTEDQLLGRTSTDPRWKAVRPDGSPLPGEAHPAMEALRTGKPLRGIPMGVHRPSGELTWLSVDAEPLPGGGVVTTFIDVTAQRRAEHAVHDQAALLRTVFDSIPNPVFLKDRESRWLQCNPAALEVVGRTLEEVLGKPDREIYPDPRIGEALEANDRRVMATGQAEVTEEEVLTPEGPRRYLSTKAPVRDGRGAVVGLVGHALDITARKREGELQALQAAIAELPIGVAVVELGPDGAVRAVAFNAAHQRITGSHPEGPTALGRLPHQLYLPGAPTPLAPAQWPGARAARTGETVHDCQLWLRRADGTRRVVSMSASPIPGIGEVRRAFVVILDITEQWESQEALRASEARYRSLVEHLPLGVAESDPAGRGVYFNPAVLALVGRPREELEATGWQRAMHPEDRPRVLAAIARARERGEPYEAALRLLRPDGTTRAVNVLGTPLPGPDGGAPGYLSVVRDVTEEHAAAAALRESTLKLEAAMASMSDALFISDLQGRFVDVNEAFARIHRFPSKEACARTFAEYPEILDLFYPDGSKVPADQWAVPRALRGETATNLEFGLRRRDTGERWVGSYSFAPIRQDGRIVGAVVVGRDVTDRLRAEEARAQLQQQLAQSQKMEVIGRLAGGVAHDFNNLLTIILTCGEELRQSFRAGTAPDAEHANDIVVAGKRAADLTRQLLAFARKQVVAPEVVDVNDLVRQTERLLGRVIGEDVKVRRALEEDAWPVEADPGLLTQVIMNLAVNARDAMPRGGTLTLSTRNVTLLPGEAPPEPEMPPGRYVALSVADTGVGMSPEVLAHLFEPFFTTKAPGEGTGLGLATVYGIMRQTGGFVAVRSAPGDGARFDLYLPATPGARPGAAAEAPGVQSGTETILLVEDEARVREITARALRGAGYQVLAAGTDEEALGIAGDPGRPVHLLLTDVVMPGLGGREVARRIRALRPGVKVLFVSGYTNEAIHRQGVLEQGLDLLQKPYTPAVLLARVRAALDASPSPPGR